MSNVSMAAPISSRKSGSKFELNEIFADDTYSVLTFKTFMLFSLSISEGKIKLFRNTFNYILSDADYKGDCQKSPKGTIRGPIFM